MPDLVIKDLDEDVVEHLRAQADRRGIALDALLRDLVVSGAGQHDPASALDAIRAMRPRLQPDPTWNTVAVIRADRESRDARLCGEDPDEAWARAYRKALEDQRGSGGSQDDAA
ncbi:MAG TPA: hypothetical protein VD970_04600 [Acetobacteraceae bacterium]|nr:hypothetical protein [Acetobacteraceae bacterium]